MNFVSMDLFTWNGKKFSVLTDWWLNYTQMIRFRREPNTQGVIKFLTDIFRQVGYSSHLRSDNGGQFRSEFSTFCRRAGIDWMPSLPYNYQYNGKVEHYEKRLRRHCTMRIESSGVENIHPCPLFFSQHTVEIGLQFFQDSQTTHR